MAISHDAALKLFPRMQLTGQADTALAKVRLSAAASYCVLENSLPPGPATDRLLEDQRLAYLRAYMILNQQSEPS